MKRTLTLDSDVPLIEVRDEDPKTGLIDSFVTTYDSVAKMFGQTFHLGWLEASQDGIVYFSCQQDSWDFVVQLAAVESKKVQDSRSGRELELRVPWVYHVFRLTPNPAGSGLIRKGELMLLSPSRILSPSFPLFYATGFFPHVSGSRSLNASTICWGDVKVPTLTPATLVDTTRTFLNSTFVSGHYTNFDAWEKYTKTGIFPDLEKTTIFNVLKGS